MTAAPQDSPAWRLVNFCRLAEEYDAWAASFPTSVSRFDLTSDRPISPHDRSYLSARALVLRKFLVVETEATNATGVLEALQDSLRAEHVSIDALRASFEQIARPVEAAHAPARREPLGQVLKDLARRVPLPGGRTKHARGDERPAVSDDLALWTFVLEGESFLRRLRRAIRTAAEVGDLASEVGEEVLAAA